MAISGVRTRQEALSGPITFSFNDNPIGPSARFVRKLVLYEIYNRMLTERKPVKFIAVDVIKWWREVVDESIDEYRANGDRASWVKQMVYKNCFPSTVRVDDQVTMVCNNYHCPWCYSRMCQIVVKESGFEDLKSDKMLNLFWLGRQTTLPFSVEDSAEKLSLAMEGEASYCRAVNSSNRAAFKAAFWHISAEPQGKMVNGPPPRWLISSRFFGLRYSSVRLSGFLHDWTTAEAEINAENLERYLRKLLKYPVEFVVGDRDLCRLAVLARKGVRLKESTGEFRKAKEAE